MNFTYLDICSGLSAPTVAWEPLGIRPVMYSEIERFPCEVLSARHGACDLRYGAKGVPLWGDFTALRMRHFGRFGIQLPDAMVGGTPCQAFSIAGLRKSLQDDRGNLSLSFVRLANAIDNVRRRAGLAPLRILWENVPGVLSVTDNAFGCFLAALVGADAPLVPPAGCKWTDAGLVTGPKRSAAWRILDAQHFGLAQRRERLFVIASAGDAAYPAEVLFELRSLQGNHPPRRQAGENVAGTLSARTQGGGGLGTDFDIDGGLVAGTLGATAGKRDWPEPEMCVAFGGNNTAGPIEVSTAVNASPTASGRMDFESETFVVGTLQVSGSATQQDAESGMDAGEIAPTLRGMSHDKSHANAGGQLAVAFGENSRAECVESEVARTLQTGGGKPGQGYPAVRDGMAVRRLTVVECARLQGFPDVEIHIEYGSRRKIEADEAEYLSSHGLSCERIDGQWFTNIAADGPMYKALGNSMAVPVLRWIGRRMQRGVMA